MPHEKVVYVIRPKKKRGARKKTLKQSTAGKRHGVYIFLEASLTMRMKRGKKGSIGRS